jgi:hypothetical protein
MINLILILLYLIPSITVLRNSSKLVSPAVLVSLSGFPFFFMNLVVSPNVLGLSETKGFQYAQLMLAINLLVQGLIFYIAYNSRQLKRFTEKLCADVRYTYNNRKLRVISTFFILLALFCFAILAFRSGGVISWLLDPRHSYITKRTGNGIFYALSLNFLMLSFFLRLISTKKIFKIFIYSFIIYIPLSFFLGSKGPMIAITICTIAYTAVFNRRAATLLILAAPILLIPLIYLSFANESIFGLVISIGKYFDYYANASLYYEDYLLGKHKLYEGKILMSSFWSMIPRLVIDTKPTIYGILHIVEYYYPGGPASGNTPAFGALVYEHADFGIPGVLVLSFFSFAPIFNAFVLRYISLYFVIIRDVRSAKSATILAICFSPYFGVYFPGPIFWIFAASMFLLLVVWRQLPTLAR